VPLVLSRVIRHVMISSVYGRNRRFLPLVATSCTDGMPLVRVSDSSPWVTSILVAGLAWMYTQIPVIFRSFCPRGLLVCLLLVLEDQSEHSRSSPEALASAKKLHGYAVFAPGSMDSRAVFQNFNGHEQESGHSLVGLAQIPNGNALARRNGSVDVGLDAAYGYACMALSLSWLPQEPSTSVLLNKKTDHERWSCVSNSTRVHPLPLSLNVVSMVSVPVKFPDGTWRRRKKVSLISRMQRHNVSTGCLPRMWPNSHVHTSINCSLSRVCLP
jgi:hypothetical protein